jgi:glycosyltransferase involved in cell wall biosynthesis
MVQQYRLQRDRLDLLLRYAAIVTLSRHMQDEYINHGLRAELVGGDELGVPTIAAKALHDYRRGRGQPWRLLFVGRMERLKGGSELLQALPDASRRLGRSLHVTFAGDGGRRQSWEAEARELNLRHPAIHVEFLGWVGPTELEGRYQHADLLALPSLWPEPLALVGSEAFKHGVPAVAFDVGGISDWLKPGINGVLAPGKPPTVHGLSDAIVTALADADTHARLSEGARSSVADFSGEEHARKVLRVLGRVSRAA